MNPWLRNIPWYAKIIRVLHCAISPIGHIIFLDYLLEDLEILIDEFEVKIP